MQGDYTSSAVKMVGERPTNVKLSRPILASFNSTPVMILFHTMVLGYVPSAIL